MFFRSYVKLSTVITGSSIISLLIGQRYSAGIWNLGPVYGADCCPVNNGAAAPGRQVGGSGIEPAFSARYVRKAHKESANRSIPKSRFESADNSL